MRAPLDRLDELLSPEVRRVAERPTPIPTIAERAKRAQAAHPELVRADIGQIVGVAPTVEVLYGPPVGLEPLRVAVAEMYLRSFALSRKLAAENVAVCTGAAEGLSLLMRCFASGRSVGLPRGHWENYDNAVELAGGRAVVVDYFDGAGALDLGGLERSIRAERLAVLVANFPCNPTGAVLSGEEARALGALAEATGVVLVADEVYARLRYDGAPPASLLAFAPGHAVSVGSASKEYLLPGARVGWVVSACADLTERVLRRLIRASSASPGVLGQERVLALMEADLVDLREGRAAGWLARTREAMRERRDLLLAVLERHGMASVGRPGHRCEGTIFLMAALPAWWRGDDVAFCERALELGCFSAIPGSAFGLPGSVRLSFGGTSPSDIARLDARIGVLRAASA